MKTINLDMSLYIFSYNQLQEDELVLIDKATLAALSAYAPYSKFQVGAACLLANGEIVTGSNQENAAYPSGLCAERVALFYAGAQYPDIPVEAMAIVAYAGGKQVNMISPCGACRQVLLETGNRYKQPVKIFLCGTEDIYMIEDASSLLPVSFDGSDLP